MTAAIEDTLIILIRLYCIASNKLYKSFLETWHHVVAAQIYIVSQNKNNQTHLRNPQVSIYIE